MNFKWLHTIDFGELIAYTINRLWLGYTGFSALLVLSAQFYNATSFAIVGGYALLFAFVPAVGYFVGKTEEHIVVTLLAILQFGLFYARIILPIELRPIVALFVGVIIIQYYDTKQAQKEAEYDSVKDIVDDHD